jgi:hypothetical protein
MDNVVFFPAIHFVRQAYWHHGQPYPDLPTLQASLPERDLVRALEWQERRERWQNSRKRTPSTAAGGGSAA